MPLDREGGAVPAADDCTILLSSAGRRPYLVRWFREALAMHGITGRVIVADVNPRCPARAVADSFVLAPRVTDPAYEDWLRSTVDASGVRLALSVNDFELSTWATLESPPAALVALDGPMQRVVEDKLSSADAVRAVGVDVPRTWVASEVLDVAGFPPDVPEAFVVKSRFGSGSVGLRFADRRGLAGAIAAASGEVLDRIGARVDDDRRALEHVIVQERIQGTEFGVDVVDDLDGRFAGCFARRKLSMRHGETDEAVTVDATPFAASAAALAGLTRHRGLIDTDVMVDRDGRAWLIDVNPRFGGGYPFSHVAGAHAPAAMVAWALGREVEPGWLESRPGVASAKSIDVVEVGHAPTEAPPPVGSAQR